GRQRTGPHGLRGLRRPARARPRRRARPPPAVPTVPRCPPGSLVRPRLHPGRPAAAQPAGRPGLGGGTAAAGRPRTHLRPADLATPTGSGRGDLPRPAAVAGGARARRPAGGTRSGAPRAVARRDAPVRRRGPAGRAQAVGAAIGVADLVGGGTAAGGPGGDRDLQPLPVHVRQQLSGGQAGHRVRRPVACLPGVDERPQRGGAGRAVPGDRGAGVPRGPAPFGLQPSQQLAAALRVATGRTRAEPPHPGGAAAPWRSRRTLAEPPRPGGPPPARAIPSTYRRVTTRRVAATGEGGVAVARHLPDSPAELSRALAGTGYLPDTGLATAGWLALRLDRPLFLEGDAGVGKTSFAAALAEATGLELIRLQCYEGL